jgi:hypothetical protein
MVLCKKLYRLDLKNTCSFLFGITNLPAGVGRFYILKPPCGVFSI